MHIYLLLFIIQIFAEPFTWIHPFHYVPPDTEGLDWNSPVFSKERPKKIAYTMFQTSQEFKASHERDLTNFELKVLASLPENYDPRERFGHCLSLKTILNQGQCGACWAFSASGIAADRLCIAGIANIVPSPQYSLSCDRTCLSSNSQQCNMGCRGGFMGAACEFITNKFVTTEQCIPYTGKEGQCPQSCTNGQPFTSNNTWRGATIRHLRNENEIMVAIYTTGPVTAGFQVYSDFEQYRGGVYRRSSGQNLGGHAIKIVGWGVEGGVKYWLCQNSWGSSWGEGGFFKFLRGQNHCSMEEEVWEMTFAQSQPDDPTPTPTPPTPTPPTPEPQPVDPNPPTPTPPQPIPPTPTPPTPTPPQPQPVDPQPPRPGPYPPRPGPYPPQPGPYPPSPYNPYHP